MCIDKLLSVIIFCPMSEQRKDANSLLCLSSSIKLHAFKKFSLSPPKKNSSSGGTFLSSNVSFILSKLYSSFISSIVFSFSTLSFIQSSCKILSNFVDKTFISESPSSISGGSGTSFNALSIFSITFSGFPMTFSPNFAFIRK